MKWGKSNRIAYKRQRKRRLIFNLRQSFADACQIPVRYIFGSNASPLLEPFKKLRETEKVIRVDCDKLTRKLPRKLKKKLRKTYRSFK